MEVETDASAIRLELMDSTSGAAAAEEGKGMKEVVTTKSDETKNGTLSNNHKEPNGENDERKTAIRLCKTSKFIASNIDK